jgi:hemoglobin
MSYDERSVYDRVGGEPFFVALVDAFYRCVETDDLLRPMYPDDLTESRQHLVWFLAQYWGGPQVYAEQRGHPRLRMRHAPFEIGKRARDAWLSAMDAALDEVAPTIDGEVKGELHAYFEMSANSLRNV